MADMEGFPSIFSNTLSLIEKHEKEYMVLLNDSEFRYCILDIKLGFQSLVTFYNISNNEDLKRSICEVSENVMQELQSLSGRPIDEGIVKFLCNAYDKLGDKIVYDVRDPKTHEWDIIFLSTFIKTICDFIVKSLRELSSSKANRNAPSIKEKLLRLHDFLAYIGDTGVGFTKENQELLNLVFQAACLVYSCLVGQKENPLELEILHNLSKYLKEIYMAFSISLKFQCLLKDLFKDEIHLLDSVMKLLDFTSTSNIGLKDVCEKLHHKLEFLKIFLTDLPHETIIENFIHFTPFIENMTAAALRILHLCFDIDMKEDLFIEVNGVLADVIDQIEDPSRA